MQVLARTHLRSLYVGTAFVSSVRPRKTLKSPTLAMQSSLQKVVVRAPPSDEQLTIVLTLNGQQRNLTRLKTENLDKPLFRIQKSAAAPGSGSNKSRRRGKGGPSTAGLPQVALHEGSTADSPVVSGDIPNYAAWQHGRLLRVGKQEFLVDRDPPTVQKIEAIGKAIVGCPVLASAMLQFASEEASQWAWHKRPASTTHRIGSAADAMNFTPISTAGPRYTPTAADVGCMLRVDCTPAVELPSQRSDGTAQLRTGATESLQVGPVEAGPEARAIAARHALTVAPLAHPHFRVVTYNILADQYASSAAGSNKLFTYCPREFLDSHYRRPLILVELLRFNADIICLQEVDEKAFATYFQPHFNAAGFDGKYTNKAGATSEGSAMFWRRSRFWALATKDINFRQVFQRLNDASEDDAGCHAQLLPLLRSSTALVESLQRVGTIAQMVLLAPIAQGNSATAAAVDASRSMAANSNNGSSTATDHSGNCSQDAAAGDAICVLNTHMFYHPRAPHIRNIHTAALMHEAEQFLRNSQQQQASAARAAILLCGDLNSDLNEGIPGTVELLRSGSLPATFWDWREGAGFAFRNRNGNGNNGSAQQQEVTDMEEDDGGASAAAANDATDSVPSNGATSAVYGADLQIPFHLASAGGLATPFTNYVRNYKGALDYVWYEPERMQVLRQIPLPSEEDVQDYLPSQDFPSDHLSVVFDMALRSGGDARDASGPAASQQVSAADVASGEVQPVPALLTNVPVAVEALRSGGIVAIPTDTLYGLAALGTSSGGIERIYEAKHRQLHSPLAICLADVFDVPRYGEVGHLPCSLLRELLPGAVTLVLRRRPDAPLAADLNPGVATIGIRIPDSGFIRDVCRGVGGAIALTSANLSGRMSPLAVTEFTSLWPFCAAVFDGGRIDYANREGSCILDLTQPRHFRILRRGSEAVAQRCETLLVETYGMRQWPMHS